MLEVGHVRRSIENDEKKKLWWIEEHAACQLMAVAVGPVGHSFKVLKIF